jgi:hypothetical protein
MISLVLTYFALFLNAAIFVRLFTYQRHGADYRFWISAIAATCMGLAGATVIYIAKGVIVLTPVQWPLLLILSMLFVSVNRHKGNMARVLEHYASWDGRDRRSTD